MSERNGGWTISDHAWDRMGPMGLSRADVVQVLRDPEQTYASEYGREAGEERRVFQRADIAVIVDEVTRRVVTVVWRCQEKWHRRDDPTRPR